MYKNKHIYSFQQKLSSQITKFGGLGTWLRRRLSMLLKLLTALMVMICKEAMVGNHSLRSCKPPAFKLTQFVDSRAWQVLISMEVNTKRECCW